MFLAASELNVETSVVRATQPNPEGFLGRGVNAQPDPVTGVDATLVLHGSLVEQSYQGGVFVLGSLATIDACLVRDTVGTDGKFGDGVAVISMLGPSDTTITATRIDRSARAAVSVHGAHTAISGSALACQAFDLDVTSVEGVASTLEDLGGNVCGCPEPTNPCKALSAGLEPPTPLMSE